MAKEPINVKEIMRSMYFDNDFLQKIDCSAKQNKEYLNILKNGGSLPEGTFRYRFEDGSELNTFYTVYDAGLTDAEKIEYISLKQLEALKSIKSHVTFFTIVTVIGLIIGFLTFISAIS